MTSNFGSIAQTSEKQSAHGPPVQAIALIYDRTAVNQLNIGSGWLIAAGKVATVAHPLLPFARQMAALEVRFPKLNKTFGVQAIQFHPKFDQRRARQTGEQGSLTDSPEAALQNFNCAILTLSNELPAINQEIIENVSRSIRFPINLSDEDFRGSLNEIEFPLVLQTVVNAKREGVLYILDELNRPRAQIFCQGGRIIAAKYKNLLNELAIYQIIEKGVTGRFVFHNCRQPSWAKQEPISPPPAMLLLEAHRRLDELAPIKTRLDLGSTYFARAKKHLDINQITSDLQELAGSLWHVLDGMTETSDLWRLVGNDDHTIFRTLDELQKLQQIRHVVDGTKELEALNKSPNKQLPLDPPALGINLALEPLQEITSISLDSNSREYGQTRLKQGILLGAIDPYDPWHLLHDIPLLPEASGTPIFREGAVIGIHLGIVPSTPELQNPSGMLQQMLWIEAIVDCLKAAGERELVQKLGASDRDAADSGKKGSTTSGCTEIAALNCPRCGEMTFHSARTCSRCRLRLLPDAAGKAAVSRSKWLLIACTILILIFSTAAEIAWSRLPQPSFQVDRLALIPKTPWIKVSILKANPQTGNWDQQPPDVQFVNGEMIKFTLSAIKSSYVYLIAKGTGSAKANLIYPPQGVPNMLPEGSTIVYPVTTSEQQGKAHILRGGMKFGGPPGQETIITFASEQPIEWLKDAQYLDSAFECANQLLESTKMATGIEINENRFASDLHNMPNQPSEAADSTIFISCLKANHH